MTHSTHGLRRVQEKKRSGSSPKYESRYGKLMDNLIYISAVFGPFLLLPQIINIWIKRNASGVSVVAWTGFLVTAIFWLIYGIIHRERAIIIAYIVWIILDVIIVAGIIMFG